tara:strand:+ start:28235 stop:29761 length:1527 start_codon:yes stop_codon:yes gene_type:complete
MAQASDSVSIVSGSSLIFIGTIFELGIAFIAKIFIARYLGVYDYGIVSVGIIVLSISTTFVVLGLHHGVARYLPRFKQASDKRGILLSAFSITTLISLLFAFCLFIFADYVAINVFSNPSFSPVLKVFAGAVPFAAFIRMVIGSMQGEKKASPTVFIQNIVLPSARFILIIIVLLIGVSAVKVAWAYLLAYAIAALVGVYALYRYTQMFKNVTPVYHFRDLTYFSIPLAISTIMALLFVDADTLILAYFQPATEVGLYAVIYPLSALLMIFLNSFTFLSMPALSELHAQNHSLRMRKMYLVITKWIFIPTFPLFLALFFFPNTLIEFFFGNDYTPASIGLSILSLGFLFHILTGVNESTLLAIGKTKHILANTTAAGILNIILNLILIPQYSFIGAAIATTLSYICLNLLHSLELYWMTGIHPISKPVIKISLVATSMASLVYFLSVRIDLNNLQLLLLTFIFGLIYCITIFRSDAMGAEEELLLSQTEAFFGINLDPLRKTINFFSR